jgi:hypothetical protein
MVIAEKWNNNVQIQILTDGGNTTL